jgi:hypothetical protein
MNIARLAGGSIALCAALAAGIILVKTPARGFDVQGSTVTIKRPATDITDTYFFPSPTNSNNVVAVMDVQAGIPAGAGLTTFFDQGVLYEMKFDTRYTSEAVGSRPVENVVIQFAVGAPSGTAGNQTQQINVYGPGAPTDIGAHDHLISGGNATGVGFINRPFSIEEGDIKIFAGTRQDPQFFNRSQFFSIFPGSTQANGGTSCLSSTCPDGFTPATDYYADSNVLSFVVEMPKALLLGQPTSSGSVIAYWATTSTSTGS